VRLNATDRFVADLRIEGRVLVLGGGAIIALGYERRTKDADVWLEPFDSPEAWALAVITVLSKHSESRPTRLFPPRDIAMTDISRAIAEDKVIRIMGLEKPLDIFREPNELEDVSFEDAWARSEPFLGAVRCLCPSMLLATKENTGRPKDEGDICFLRELLRERMAPELKSCDPDRARELFNDYIDTAVLEAALDNPDPAVQEIGRVHLRQFAEDGDPYAIEAWQKRFGRL
jgi:hypothetical protein